MVRQVDDWHPALTLSGNQVRLRLPPKAARTEGPPEGADAPMHQSREARLPAWPLHSPEGAILGIDVVGAWSGIGHGRKVVTDDRKMRLLELYEARGDPDTFAEAKRLYEQALAGAEASDPETLGVRLPAGVPWTLRAAAGCGPIRARDRVGPRRR